MISIGGYNQLEVQKGQEYHYQKGVLRLNTGRNALELILKIRKYSKVFLPYYTCETVLEPIYKLGLEYEFYSISKNLEPLFDYNRVNEDKGFLYINYFGIKDDFVKLLTKDCKNIILDNSQAFFSYPPKKVDTFYSCRKFFGVPDGAYLYLGDDIVPDFSIDISVSRCMHLLKRIEFGAESGFEDFKKNERSLIGQPIRTMSKLTRTLLKGVDYEDVKKRRLNNFLLLNDLLHKYNKLSIKTDYISSPLVYPFLSDIVDLRKKLIQKKIYVAQYWPGVKKILTKNNIVEETFYTDLCPLPINQNLNHDDLNFISKQIFYEMKGTNA